MVQSRPNEKSDFYNPQRDLAYFYPNMMKAAIEGMATASWPDDLRELLECYGITERHLAAAIHAYASAHALFTNDPDVKLATDALTKCGWYKQPLVVRLVLLARLGDLLTGGFFVGVRDVTLMGRLPPQLKDIADVVAAGKLVADYLRGQPLEILSEDSKDLQLESMRVEVQMAKTALAQQLTMTTAAKKAELNAFRESRAARATIQSLTTERNDALAVSRELDARLSQVKLQMQRELACYRSQGIFQLLRSWWSWRKHKDSPIQTNSTV